MKKLTALLVAGLMAGSLAVTASAYWEPEEAFGEVKFTIGKQTVAWNPDGTITDGEYYKVEIDPSWISYAINDNDTDAGLEYAKSVTPELYMSWDESNIYCATRYEVTKGHENLWDGDPASMWYSGAVQFNYANFDEVASEYRLEYGVGLSSDTGDTLYTVWADGAGTGFTPSEENAKVWLDGNTLTYETKVAWEDFADEDNTAGKEGLGFNFCIVWSIGEGQDYVHIQLAEGCTGNGKHAENFAQVTLGGPIEVAPADPNAPAILWDFNADGAMDASMGANSGANTLSWTADKDDAGNEYYTFTASGADPYVSVDMSAPDVSDVVWAKARVKNAGPATAIELFGHTNDRGLTGSECTHINVGTDGEWHTYIIYIPDENVATVNAYKDPQYAITEPYWEGTVDWIRLDPMWQEGDDGNDAGGSMNDGDQIMIDYIAFFSSEEAAKAFRSDLDSEYVAPEEPAVEEPVAEEPAAEEPAAEEPAAESKGFADVTAAADGKNVITAYTFTEGTSGFGGEGPENLFDGDTATKFCTNEFPAEAVVELDGVYTINGFTMATANDNADYNGRSPNAWTISVSADGENWTELASGDDSFFEETNFTYYVGDASAEGVSYVKFNAAGTESGTFQVSELTLFGDKTADAAADAEPVDEAMDDKAEAPQTFDFGIIAAVSAVISLAGFAAAKKHH